MNILFATSEALPYIKTGGLADVSGALPPVLCQAGLDVRLVLPAYPSAMESLIDCHEVAQLHLSDHSPLIRILEGRGQEGMRVYLIEAGEAFHRNGSPYTAPHGGDWPDNPHRFALFCRAVTAIALNQAQLNWPVDLVHTNDWQTGLIPALLHQHKQRPATLFTIHNLSYQGIFHHSVFQDLALPANLWHMNGLEYYGQLSFIKGGLVYADRINTVSPTYAQEIRTPQFGCGIEGLLNHRSSHLSGILNGIDYQTWNPAEDTNLAATFNADRLDARANNKRALQRHFGLAESDEAMLFGHIGRLVAQKGVDLILGLLPRLHLLGKIQIVILGSGDPLLESALHQAQDQYPELISCTIGYNEPLAHQIEAGCDAFLMPSRFEPCGLNQLYSLRYGALPIVHKTGGLADSVIDTNEENLASGRANGFVFEHADPQGIWYAVDQAIRCYREQPGTWKQLMRNAMAVDHSWHRSAQEYIQLYHQILSD